MSIKAEAMLYTHTAETLHFLAYTALVILPKNKLNLQILKIMLFFYNNMIIR
jgi:hypothetical protein